MKKIGYQGIKGSNNEIAVNKFVEDISGDVELLPLVSSKNVVNALLNEEIELGVMAIRNNIGGAVRETQEALCDDIVLLKEIDVYIHHCLFFKNKEINKNDIKYVASHEQALIQTQNSLSKIFDNIELVKVANTAVGAKQLGDGELNDKHAVICTMIAGVDNNLYLFKENIEDRESITTFGLFKKRK